MIAVDTNILVFAHRSDAEWHARAQSCVRELAEGGVAWAIPWPCVHEFLAIATHPRIYDPPTPLPTAIEQIMKLGWKILLPLSLANILVTGLVILALN